MGRRISDRKPDAVQESTDGALRERGRLLGILDAMEDGVYVVNPQYAIEYVNPVLIREFGPVEGRKCYEYFHGRREVCPWCKNAEVFAGRTVRWEWTSPKSGKVYDLVDTPLRNPDGSVSKLEIFRDITRHAKAEEALGGALEESAARRAEIEALHAAARAILEYHEFADAAREIFGSCRGLIGATAGYVALLNAAGTDNDVVFLEAGGRPCSVDPALPMPIRGLREVAYRTGQPVFENDFAGSPWVKFMPPGHAALDNVLFAPLVLQGKVCGLLGLANKPGGFTENDARMASAFGKLAAIALQNSRMLEAQRRAEEEIRRINADLERRVGQRTAELETANQDLAGQMALRLRLEREVLEASEAERRRIGRDLHDTLGQNLTALAFLLNALARRVAGRIPEETCTVQQLQHQVKKAIAEVRSLAKGLDPVGLHQGGLAASLAELADTTQRQSGVACRFRCESPVAIKDETVATHLFRIAQEAVNNALKHAQPGAIEMVLEDRAGEIVLTVEDNGVGMTKKAARGKGMGMHTMRYRADAIGGTLRVQPGARAGTAVICSWPRPA